MDAANLVVVALATGLQSPISLLTAQVAIQFVAHFNASETAHQAHLKEAGGVGGGGGGHDAWLCRCLQLAAPAGLSPLTTALPLNAFPLQAAAPSGLSPPCGLPLPAWPILTSLHALPFPWYVVPTEPPDCPGFATPCRVHTEEGNGPRRWPGAPKRTPPWGWGGSRLSEYAGWYFRVYVRARLLRGASSKLDGEGGSEWPGTGGGLLLRYTTQPCCRTSPCVAVARSAGLPRGCAAPPRHPPAPGMAPRPQHSECTLLRVREVLEVAEDSPPQKYGGGLYPPPKRTR